MYRKKVMTKREKEKMMISNKPLLKGISKDELQDMEQRLSMRQKAFKKNAHILHAGDYVRELGVVMEGSIRIERIDLWGNKTIIGYGSPGEVFVESYALLNQPLRIDVIANDPARILFIDLQLLLQDRFSDCSWQLKLLRNVLAMSCNKSLLLSDYITCISPKKLRRRLLTYLSEFAIQCGKTTFDIPFNREQLASYLNADRSALSNELCKMRDDGLLTFHKNHFELLNVDAELPNIKQPMRDDRMLYAYWIMTDGK